MVRSTLLELFASTRSKVREHSLGSAHQIPTRIVSGNPETALKHRFGMMHQLLSRNRALPNFGSKMATHAATIFVFLCSSLEQKNSGRRNSGRRMSAEIFGGRSFLTASLDFRSGQCLRFAWWPARTRFSKIKEKCSENEPDWKFGCQIRIQ